MFKVKMCPRNIMAVKWNYGDVELFEALKKEGFCLYWNKHAPPCEICGESLSKHLFLERNENDELLICPGNWIIKDEALGTNHPYLEWTQKQFEKYTFSEK